MTRLVSFLTLSLGMLLTGCAYSLHPYSRPADVKLRVRSVQPEECAVRVTAAEPPSNYPVPADGRVTFTVPSFRRGCSTYLFGVIKIADASPARIRVVEVRRDGRVLRRFSLTQLTSLPEDEGGYRIVTVGD